MRRWLSFAGLAEDYSAETKTKTKPRKSARSSMISRVETDQFSRHKPVSLDASLETNRH